MHDVANTVNRDIKPDNMLFMTQEGGTDRKGDRAQIADFTTVTKGPEGEMDFSVSGDMGTMCFQPPEVFAAAKFRAKPLDVWALGVSIYSVVFGKIPFLTK